ncbi:MAG: cytochrome c oxidase subunit 3 [Ferruginibacter sp.]
MGALLMEQRKKIHPYKFNLWVAMGSMVMMFAGLTSAYVVKRNQPNWQVFELPHLFWYSTAVILISSVTMHLALRAFKKTQKSKYRTLISVTFLLGVLFVVCQFIGFYQLQQKGVTMQKNVSYSFLYVIAGLHVIHLIGGVIALLVLFIKAFSKKVKTYDPVPVEVMATYWHFVDFLWIYLLLFLMAIR